GRGFSLKASSDLVSITQASANVSIWTRFFSKKRDSSAASRLEDDQYQKLSEIVTMAKLIGKSLLIVLTLTSIISLLQKKASMRYSIGRLLIPIYMQNN
ncbi:MAG: hypothetical protein ACN4E2_01200, partial [Nitrospinota bacterium]